jgi:HTH-type transcriptional regulator/antitoxin HigA
MNIRPIRTDDDYEAALAEIDLLFDADARTPEGDRLQILVTLVRAYEDQHHKLPPPDPVEAIEYYMESRGLSRRDLEPFIGSRARVSEVLNRRRPLTLRMIRNLEEGLGIPSEILIRPYELRSQSGPEDGVGKAPSARSPGGLAQVGNPQTI